MPNVDPKTLLNQALQFNKEHALQIEKWQRRSTAKPSRLSPSEDDEPQAPKPLSEAMFELNEAAQRLDEAKSRNRLIKCWESEGWAPAGKSTCNRLWKQCDSCRKAGKGSPPKAWKVTTGRPQLATSAEFLEACNEMEKGGHMSLSKADAHKVLLELSKKHSEEKSERRPDKQHEPSGASVDRCFALCSDRCSKKLLHGKMQMKSMT